MFKKLKAFFAKSTENLADIAGELKADYQQSTQAESPEMERIRANRWPSLEHITLALCAPARFAVLAGNDPFLNEFGHVDERQKKLIQKRLKQDFDIFDLESAQQVLIGMTRMDDSVYARILIMDIATSTVDAGICTFEDVQGYCLDAMDPLLLDHSLEDWDSFAEAILEDEIFEKRFYAWSMKGACKELQKNPNSPWSIFSLDQIKLAYITDHCDLERRKEIQAFMANLRTPTFDQIALALCAPFRQGMSYGAITRLFAYGEMGPDELADFAEAMDSAIGLTDAIQLREELDALQANAHMPYFAATGLFIITSAVELGFVHTEDYRAEMTAFMRTILHHPDMQDWPDLAQSIFATNEEYLIQDPNYLDSVLVELLRQGNSPWQVFAWDLVKTTFDDLTE